MSEEADLVLPDNEQCQCFSHNKATFMSLGGVPRYLRCKQEPVFVLSEKESTREDGKVGQMTLCSACLVNYLEANAEGVAKVEEIKATDYKYARQDLQDYRS